MRNNKAGPVPHKLTHCGLYYHLGAGINIARCLVKYEHMRIEQHSSRNGHQLFLSLGNARAVIAQDRVIAIRQAHDKVVDMCCLGGGYNIFLGCILIGIGDVFHDASAEQPCILQDHSIRSTEAFSGHSVYRLIVYRYAAAVHIIETHQKIDYCRLSCSGGADYRYEAAVRSG